MKNIVKIMEESTTLKIKNFLENTKLVMSISILAIALSVCYYFVIWQPAIQRERFELEKREFEIKQEKNEQGEKDFKNCMLVTDSNYIENWNLRCQKVKKPEGCALPGYLSSDLNKIREETRLNCAKLYK